MAPVLDQLALSKDDLDFFRRQLNTEDETELKAHIINVASQAYEVFPYGCIETFSFVKAKAKLYDEHEAASAYRGALKVCSERDGLFLDYGCCFGVDLRKAVEDGLPAGNAIGVDVHSAFWDLGHKLFKSTREKFPATFLSGNALDLSFVSGRRLCTETPNTGRPNLEALTSLIPLQGHISAVHAGNVFHLFDEDKQLELARALSSLLRPTSGSVIFGCQGTKEVAGEFTNQRGETHFGHSPGSWKQMWDGDVFPSGSVRVSTKLVPIPQYENYAAGIAGLLVWSCIIL
ncbi:hypothetical protein V5O48_005711 [Marasmius crinis-equi]|uniref:Methyltransferase domain-containing protein n=1 Tax=Marasmius crinis-equi TaxID=585013 RepID=A0ABR3FLY2_9AGAR